MIHADILGERARLSPARTALMEVATSRRWTYSELNQRAERAARAWLDGLKLKKGDRLGLLSANRVEFLDMFFAAAKSGIILVPLGTRLTAVELAAIAEDCGLSALMVDDEHAGTARELSKLIDVGTMVALDSHPDMASWSNLLAAVDGASPLPGFCDPEDPLCLLYTSGTTGRPKGVITPHRQVTWNAYNTTTCWQLGEDDVSPIFTPLYHAGGLGAFLTPIMLAGGSIVLHREFDATEVWRTIVEERCTVVLGVPTIWKMLADAPEFKTADLEHVRWFISGGAPMPRHLIQVYRDRGIVMRQGYGLTEVGVNCFAMNDEEAWRKAGSIGRPLMFTEAKVIGPEGETLPSDEVGELLFRGPHISGGYWNNPDATALAYDAEGWFHTGDMARCDDDGFFTIAGRAKDMFISGGVNIYPAEIENALLQHPQVLDAAVVGLPDGTWGEIGVAFIVLPDDETMSAEAFNCFLAERIAKFKIPKLYRRIDELPRTPYGKVVKARLVDDLKKENP